MAAVLTILGPFGLGGPELVILLIIIVVLIALLSRRKKKAPKPSEATTNVSNIHIHNQANANGNSTSSPSDKLIELKKLKEQGVITEEDFQKKKEEIMKSF